MSPRSPAAYSKAKLQVPAPDRQVKAPPGPNVAAINPLVVVQSAPTAVHPAGLNVPPLTVPSRYPWKVPLMPAATATVASQRLIACLPAPCVQYRLVKGTLSVRRSGLPVEVARACSGGVRAS